MSVLKTIEKVKNSPFTLKALKSVPSRNGVHWTANIYEGSTKVGSVEDEGRGGEIAIHADKSIIERLTKLSDDPTAYEAAGTYLAELSDATETYNKMKRACAKKTLYIDHTSQEGEYFINSTPFSEENKKRILGKNEKPESVVFINEIL